MAETTNAVETARTLGTEHGTRDAEAWPPFPMTQRHWDELLQNDPDNGWRDPWCWPEPDLTDPYHPVGVMGSIGCDYAGKPRQRIVAAYVSAYRAAVENTIREATR